LLVIALLCTGCDNSNNPFQSRGARKRAADKAENAKQLKRAERLQKQQRELQEEALRGTSARPGR
jgi:hypothetical protein